MKYRINPLNTVKICLFVVLLILAIMPITVEAKEQEITIGEKVLVDEQGIIIKVTGYGETMDSPYIALELINNTSYNLTISLNRTSVNGIMFPDASLYKTITAQTTNKASIDFMSLLLENVGITTIAEVETAFKINGEDENAPDFETDIVKIYTSASDSFTQTYDDSGEILFDEQNIRMIKKELSINEYITGWDFYIDNTSEHRIQIVATQNTVNGKNIESTLTFQPIECGKKAYE